jgi:hypothetical protein
MGWFSVLAVQFKFCTCAAAPAALVPLAHRGDTQTFLCVVVAVFNIVMKPYLTYLLTYLGCRSERLLVKLGQTAATTTRI